jgi:hypothetical protein
MPGPPDLQRPENAELHGHRLAGHRISSHVPTRLSALAARTSGFGPFHHQTHRCSKPWSSRSKAIPGAMRCGVSADNATRHREKRLPGQPKGHPMNHQPAPAQPPRIPRTLAGLGGLAVCLAAAIGLAPAAAATSAPPTPAVAPIPPPPPAPAHLPPWAIAAILAATVVLSVATTLITLALERLRWARRQAAATPEPHASTPSRDP